MAGSIAEFAPVPADNGMAPPIGAPEGATKLKALNDIMRNQNAAARSWYNDPLWRDVRDGTPNASYTFDSANSFRVNSTAALPFYPVGKRLKIVAGGYTRQGYVTASVTSGSDTVVTCSLDGALTNVAFTVYTAAVEFTSLPGAPAFTAADQIMVSTGAGLVSALDVPASRFLGKKAAGGISAMTAAEAIAVLGLGNVENKSSATIRGELTSANVTGALGYTPYGASATINRVATSGITAGALGSISVSGNTGGWAGIHLSDYNRVIMANAAGAGVYDNAAGQWIFFFSGSGGSGSLAAGVVPWTSVTGRPTAISQFTNDSGFITGAALSGYATTTYVNSTFLSRALDAWQTSADGRNRFYFGSNGTTYVVGDGAIYFSTNNAGSYGVTMSGNQVIAGDFYVQSDRKLKSRIRALDGAAALAGIRAIGGKRYVKGGQAELGVIYQDVRRHFPEQTSMGEDGFGRVGNMNGPIFAAIEHLAAAVERAGIKL